MMLALLLALAAPQDTAWVKAGDIGEMVMEIDPASHRAEGDLHRFRARISAADSERAMILNLSIDCSDRVMTIEGQTELYVGGKFSEKLTPPDNVTKSSADSDPIASASYDYYCKAS